MLSALSLDYLRNLVTLIGLRSSSKVEMGMMCIAFESEASEEWKQYMYSEEEEEEDRFDRQMSLSP